MRLLSCKLELCKSFNRENFYAILITWLKSSSYAGNMGELFDAEQNMASTSLETEFCKLETITIEKYVLFKLTNKYYEQCWETQAVFYEDKGCKYVVIHIDCSGDTSRLGDNIPIMRTDIIRAFVSSGMPAQTRIPLKSEPILAGDGLKSWLLDTVNGRIKNSFPIVFASKIEGIMGYNIDENSLSKRLAGLAAVVVENESDFAFSLKEQTGGKIPYNGYVGVFYPDSRNNKIYRRKKGVALENEIEDEIVKFITARTDEEKLDWDALHTKEKKELVVLLDDKSSSLETELKEAKQRIAELEAKNSNLQSYAEKLKITNGLIQTANEIELFEFEQYDLIVSCLEAELANCVEGSRKYDLLKKLLEKNPLKGIGKEIYDKSKAIISKGKLSERDFAELSKLGFENVSDNKHYRFIFRSDNKHKLTFVNTPSDPRSGKNLAADVLNAISVYR